MRIYKVYKRICLGKWEICANCENKEIKEFYAFNANLTKGSGICHKTLKIVPYVYELIEDRTKT
jgi:hypothetical protein